MSEQTLAERARRLTLLCEACGHWFHGELECPDPDGECGCVIEGAGEPENPRLVLAEAASALSAAEERIKLADTMARAVRAYVYSRSNEASNEAWHLLLDSEVAYRASEERK